jgi:hypothetical protein
MGIIGYNRKGQRAPKLNIWLVCTPNVGMLQIAAGDRRMARSAEQRTSGETLGRLIFRRRPSKFRRIAPFELGGAHVLSLRLVIAIGPRDLQ